MGENLSKLLTSDELSYQISHKQTNQLEVRMKIVHCKSWNSFCKIVYSFWCHRPLTLSPLPLDDFIKKWTHQKPPETHQKDLVKIMSDVEKPMSFLKLQKMKKHGKQMLLRILIEKQREY
jgi:hypothetical protein